MQKYSAHVGSRLATGTWLWFAHAQKQIADQAKAHGIPESEVVERLMLTQNAIKRLIEPYEVAQLCAVGRQDRRVDPYARPRGRLN